MRTMLLIITGALLALTPGLAHAQADDPPYPPHVRVHAQIVLIDRTQARRAGLRYVQVGGGRILVEGGRGRGSGVGVAGEVSGVPVSAFLDLVRKRRLLSSEIRTQITILSGSTGSIGSGSLRVVDPWGTSRAQGPELVVTPTVLRSGEVRLEVRARLRDEVTGPYGYGVDASPVDAATTVIVRPGEEATLGNVQSATRHRDTGFFRWEDVSGSRDVLVVLRPEIVKM
ncbi:MAG: type II and III secretion system protein [Gemmatimonadota bacterium]|nr:type II and III secretion system protein [Gemmatimonadota bacterium]